MKESTFVGVEVIDLETLPGACQMVCVRGRS
jgi:hypothetical protein